MENHKKHVSTLWDDDDIHKQTDWWRLIDESNAAQARVGTRREVGKAEKKKKKQRKKMQKASKKKNKKIKKKR